MKLEDFEKLANAATPGPWETNGSGGYVCFLSIYDEQPRHYVSSPSSKGLHLSNPDAAFIAACRDMVPKLIKALKIASEYLSDYETWEDAIADLEQP